jgi:hypothetical protein
VHYTEEKNQIKPMGTLNLKKVIEQSLRNQKIESGRGGGRMNKSVLLLGKLNQNKLSYGSP